MGQTADFWAKRDFWGKAHLEVFRRDFMHFTLVVAVASFSIANFSEICEMCRRGFAGDAGSGIGGWCGSRLSGIPTWDLLERFWPKRKRAGGDLLGSVPSALCMGRIERVCGWCQGERCHGGGVWNDGVSFDSGSGEGKGVVGRIGWAVGCANRSLRSGRTGSGEGRVW